ncbi:MAG: hypothetical protein M1823_005211 [Watsoniomyces obsoletus]|nr:MAG: hypothetical protein M1823_005211 [Watsoniomyces obsoletus]
MLYCVKVLLIRVCHTVAAQLMPASPVAHVPDIPSPLYPDRPIRPLPKRRLRSRLSPDRSQPLLYSPTAQEASSLFYYPYPYAEADSQGTGFRPATATNHAATSEHHPSCMCATSAESLPADGEIESEDDEPASRARPAPSSQQQQQQQESVTQLFDHPRSPVKPPESTTSSVDGYDSFENTKNKKKRKIPTPSGVGVHQTHLSADLANLDLSSRNGSEPAGASEDLIGTVGATGTTPPPSVVSPHRSALSGSGSGRLSRPNWRNGSLKSPLGVSSDGVNVWTNGRERVKAKDLVAATTNGTVTPGSPSLRRPLETVPAEVGGGHQAKKRDPGIIAAAIARAKASPTSPHVEAKDQENVSWFKPNHTRKAATQNTQFTFTAASNVAWPGEASWPSGAGSTGMNGGRPGQLAPPAPPMMAPLGKGKPAPAQLSREMSTQGTQTSPNVGVGGGGGVRRSPQTGHVPTYAKTNTKQQGMAQNPNHHQSVGPPPSQTMPQPPRPQPQQSGVQQQQQQPQASSQQQSANSGPGTAAQPAKKGRPRRPGHQYVVAARERRLQQQYKNYHHPPAADEMWICEFCEYESIFGVPPEALVRQYEIKDLKERRRVAEKRRLLEKAKMKGRKGKKASKAAAKAANNNNAAAAAATAAGAQGTTSTSTTTNHQQTQTPMPMPQHNYKSITPMQDAIYGKGPAEFLAEEYFDGEEEDDDEEEEDDDEGPILSQLRPPPATPTTTQTSNTKMNKPKARYTGPPFARINPNL